MQGIEEWRYIEGFDGRYQVSNLGRVRSLKNIVSTHGKKVVIDKVTIFKPYNTGKDRNYLTVGLTKEGERKICRVHRLVAEAFIPNPNKLPMVDHINRITSDNRVDNLRWCDGKENRRNCNYNLFFTINGQTKILEDWCNEYGINRSTVKYRLNKGLDIVSALTNPIMTPKEAALCNKRKE